MLDFEIQRCTRRCAKTERDFRPGDTFYSVLSAAGSQVVRMDYSEEAWTGAPDNIIGWWKSRMPEPHINRVLWAPNDVMLQYFEELNDADQLADERYVLALLLLRRRIVRLQETEQDPAGNGIMTLYCPKNEREYKVPVVPPGEDRVQQIQEKLAGLLFADGA